MFRPTILVIVLANLAGNALGDLMPLPLDGRIVGGSPAVIGSYPWQVSLQRSGSHYCSGSLISSSLVVTAAHCLISTAGVTIANLRVRAGSSYKYSGGILSTVKDFRVHEAYNKSDKMFDVAVIRLKTPLKLSPSLNVIPLAEVTPKHNADATCTGWGATSYQGSSSWQLFYINTRIVGRTECSGSSYGYGSKIRATMICAAFPQRDACQGDSGGPLVSDGKLVGIVSWGNKCAEPNYPGVYANVAELRDWIDRAVITI
ncbi:trypsin alpha-3 [Drosophila grimshawi]|uniref:trypsin n=1 Tax=Drosophila grimshawi TaxID=7222 RepID=B4JVG2_DROGR|nr:trypsin alpha-3 [Drosophila grimshawi]EDV98430.1 GH22680 [Drosophila grimshawi]